MILGPPRQRISNGYFEQLGALGANSFVNVINPLGPAGVYLRRLVVVAPAGAANAKVILESVINGPGFQEFYVIRFDASVAINQSVDLGDLYIAPVSALRFYNPGVGATSTSLTLHLSWHDPAALVQA